MARDRVLGQLAARGVFSRKELDAARREPVPRVRRRPPVLWPRTSRRWWRPSFPRAWPASPASAPRSTGRCRRSPSRRWRGGAKELRDQGIGNAAVVVIDNQTRGVRALVGSSGYRDTYFQGQVNGAVARRSPGSTLKPFLYAMAMDQGRLVPDSYILDIPTDFAGDVAENYDQHYRGRVTVREALITSLNAPAVRLLAETGLGDFLRLLQRGGLSTLDRPAGRYGLPLILGAGSGGCSTSSTSTPRWRREEPPAGSH